MAALQSEGEAQRLRFGPWLVSAVSSGIYQGLCWTDPSRRAFRVPWKHNARKDVTNSDVEIFRAWARVSGRYEGCPEDPAKWKTNFRCALTSTRMFKLLEDHSKRGDDPHKVFGIVPDTLWHGKEGDFSSSDPMLDQQLLHHQLQPELNPQDVAPEIPPPGGASPEQCPALEDVEALQWVLQHCNISPSNLGPPDPAWAPAEDLSHQDALLQAQPAPSQAGGLPVPACQQWVPVGEQPPPGACGPAAPALLPEGQGAVPAPGVAVHVLSPAEVTLFAPAPSPVPPPAEHSTDSFISVLDVSIFYRGRLLHQEEVGGGRCLLAYQPVDPALAERPGRLVRFPSPAGLPDGRQRDLTQQLLQDAGLQLEQRAHRLLATRLKRCKVFWALSQQLEGAEDPPCNLLDRDEETPIFDFNRFCTELRDFRNGQRQRSPDFTIYLCFGQCFSRTKPKESKLILVKLVPKFCEYWTEQVQREGASSLDSGTVSLQLSDSFSLFELIEQWDMQLD